MLIREHVLTLVAVLITLACLVFLHLNSSNSRNAAEKRIKVRNNNNKQHVFFMLKEEYPHLKEPIGLGISEQQLLKEVDSDLQESNEESVHEFFASPKSLVNGSNYGYALELFQYMPKGGLLNAHEMALCSRECIVGLTYHDNLWACESITGEIERVKFSLRTPSNVNAEVERFKTESCKWTLLREMRSIEGQRMVDQRLMKRLSLPLIRGANKTATLKKRYNDALEISEFVKNIVTYEPIWKLYHKTALRELIRNGITYIEYRTTLPQLYDLNGRKHDFILTANILLDVVEKECRRDPRLMGANMIYMPHLNISKDEYAQFLTNAHKLQIAFPDFFIGIDLLNRGETQRKISDFSENLLAVASNLNFYFSGGVSAVSCEENAIGALMLDSKRIALTENSLDNRSILKLAFNFGTAIEIDVTALDSANQTDFSQAQGLSLFRKHYPVALTTTFPMLKSLPLTEDFYETFKATASETKDLSTLKELALNSLLYSGMGAKDKLIANGVWSKQWRDWMEEAFNIVQAVEREETLQRENKP